MNQRLMQALISVSSISSEAKTLANDLLEKITPETVRALHEKIAQLEAEVVHLTQAAGHEAKELSEDDAAQLASSFYAHIAKVTVPQLYAYDLQYLSPYPSAIRLVLATCLRNHAGHRGVPPVDVWLDIIALGGNLK